MIQTIKHILLASTAFIALAAYAAPDVSLSITVEKDAVVEVQPANAKEAKKIEKLKKAGKPVPTEVKRVEAKEVLPGETLFYTINYKNSGDETAKDIKIDNPIAEGTSYLQKSAWGNNTEIQFSIDGGVSFFLPAKLTYEVQGANGVVEQRIAEPEKYNAVRWLLTEIAPNSSGQVGFSVKVN